MVIYHCITTYHLLEMIVHSVLYHQDDYTICMLPEFLYNRTVNLKYLEEKSVFSKVVCLRYRVVPHNDNYLMKMEDAFNLLDIDLDDVSEIHVAGAQYYFSSLLINKQISFNFWEEAAGVISRPEPVENIVKGISSYQFDVAKANGMFVGNNEFVNKIFCNFSAQSESFVPSSKMVDFNVVREMNSLSAKSMREIKEFFNVPQDIELPDHTALLMTQHFANLGMMTLDEQIFLYQNTVDYYLSGYNVSFKLHPDDLCYYSQLFPESTVIKEKFPSEFLPQIGKTTVDVISAISSTGVRNIAQEYKNVLLFNPEYEKSFKKNHRYYLMLSILKRLMPTDLVKVWTYGINDIQLLNMAKFSDANINIIISDDLENADFALLDCNNMGGIDELNILNIDCICLCNDYLTCFNNEEIVCKRIEKEYISENWLDDNTDLDDEFVYFKSDNESKRRSVQTMEYDKQLYYSNIKTHVSDTLDNETKIAVLEGILESTEKRLNYYINREKELLEIIEKNKLYKE